jgi:serine/threonine/tyrosine protein kinase RAD53
MFSSLTKFTYLFTRQESFFEKYKIKSHKLGSGTFGNVFLGKKMGEKTSDDRPVAIKIIPIKNKIHCAREIEILKRLPNHENVCKFIDSFENEQNIYIVLEFIDGQSLYEYLTPHLDKDLTKIPFFLEIFQQCVQAIAAIHAAGIYHRDLKLENFMITFVDDKPVVKLIDFGLSDIIGKIRQICGGSALWMAPEVILEGKIKPISQQADIWSFGMIMLEFYSGNPMFSEMSRDDQILKVATLVSPPIPQKLMDDTTAIGIWFRSLATMCLQIDPNSRPTAETLAVLSKTSIIPAA